MSGWIVATLGLTTVLMLAVLALRQPVARLFGARAAYALWLLPALRMVLPPLPATVTPVAPVLPAPADLAALIAYDPAALPAAATRAPIDWGVLVLAVWLIGATVRFALPWLAYRRFMTRVLAGGRRLGTARGIAVHLSGANAGPLAAGLLVRRIVLPRDFHVRFDRVERRLALAHEAAHHARGDTFANVAALAMLALHWWNPVAYAAWRAFRADQELACDATVLRAASAEERHAYGSALVKAAFGGSPAAVCGMARAAELKHRLRTIASVRRSAGRAAAGHWLAVAIVSAGLTATATGGAAAEGVRAIGEQVRGALPATLPSAAPTSPAVPKRPASAVAPRPAPRLSAVRSVAPSPPVAAPAAAAAEVPPVPAAPVPPAPPEWSASFFAPAASPPPFAAYDRIVAEAARARAAASRGLAAAAVASARADLTAACAARGIRVNAEGRTWRSLATCDDAASRREVRDALRQARREIAASRADLTEAERARIDAAFDRALARLDEGG